jgi:hypothetical protein
MMRPGWITAFALFLMSVVFFSPAIAPLTDQVLRETGAPSSAMLPLLSMIWNSSLPGLISLFGAIVFLAVTRRENPSWYLGIPLVAAFALIAFSPAFFELYPLRDPNPAFYNPLHVVALVSAYGTFLLPTCAALFFWSQRPLGRWATVLAIIALLVTLNSVAFWFSFFSHYLVAAGMLPASQPIIIEGQVLKSDGEGMLFLILHYLIGMPVLGVCFLAPGVLSWHTMGKVVSAPSLEAQP